MWPAALWSIGVLPVIVCSSMLACQTVTPVPGGCQLTTTTEQKRDQFTTFWTKGCSVETDFSALSGSLHRVWEIPAPEAQFPSDLPSHDCLWWPQQSRTGVRGDLGCWGAKRPTSGGEPRKSLFCSIFANAVTKRAWLEEERGETQQHRKVTFAQAADGPVKDW